MKPIIPPQIKQRISLAKIGKKRFWLGLIFGILNALLFFCFVFLVTEAVDVFSVFWEQDILHKSESKLFFEKLFLIALSVALANNTMLRVWFARPTPYFDRRNRFSSLRIFNYSKFIEYTLWFVVMSFISRFLFQFHSVNLALYETYGYILILFPVYLFFISWMEISRYIKAQRWMLKAFAISLSLVASLSFIDTSNYKVGEVTFKKMHQEKIAYVENEVEKAERLYNISFSEETVLALKELRSKRALALLEKARLAFKTEGKVSLEMIILEKILIHNFKGYYKDVNNSYSYIFPFQAYEQLKKVDKDSPEATELLNIIAEFHALAMFSHEAPDTTVKSNLYYCKKYILHDNEDYYGFDINYRRMYDQATFLVYHIRKLETYTHPFFNKKDTLPPPSTAFMPWVDEFFPEFKEE
jgi:hypothetical protein